MRAATFLVIQILLVVVAGFLVLRTGPRKPDPTVQVLGHEEGSGGSGSSTIPPLCTEMVEEEEIGPALATAWEASGGSAPAAVDETFRIARARLRAVHRRLGIRRHQLRPLAEALARFCLSVRELAGPIAARLEGVSTRLPAWVRLAHPEADGPVASLRRLDPELDRLLEERESAEAEARGAFQAVLMSGQREILAHAKGWDPFRP